MFEFESEEQRAIRKSVATLAAESIPAFQLPEFYGTVPRALFRKLSSIGLTGLAISEEHGGIDAGATTNSIVMEELAAVDLGPAIFISVHTMVSGLIAKFGSPQLKAELLPKLASGEYLGAFALTEPGAGSDAAALKTEAIPCEGGFKLRGEKCYITSAGFADIYIVFARTRKGAEKGITAFVIDGKSPGLVCASPEHKMGCELSPIASLTFQDVFVAADRILGTADDGYGVALSGLAGGRVNISACANGISRSAIELATNHLIEREQFGKKLAEFQALQFMLADMRIDLDAARLLTWRAAAQFEKDPDSKANRINASAAKCFSTDAAMRITTDAVQLLGGAGYLREYQVERKMREAKMLQIVEGTNQIQRLVIAREMLKK